MAEILTIPPNPNAELVVDLANGESYRVGADANGVIYVDWSNVQPDDSFTLDWKPVYKGANTVIYAYGEPRTNFAPGGYPVSAFSNTQTIEFIEPEDIGGGGDQDGNDQSDEGTGIGGNGFFGLKSHNWIQLIIAIAASVANERLRR